MKPPATTLLEHLRRLTCPPAADTVLLDRWVHQRDEQAFAALVARHGPMVLGVCQRILGDAHEAEDALQATFLILARKAASLRRPEALACWLHGVAARLARKARTAARRRAGHSRILVAEPADSQPDPLDLLSVREMLGLIDEEIRALREAYRLPVVLCDLEGRTQEEAAGLLGWTVGSLRGRLLRGREQLRKRLARRGLTLPAGIALPLVPAALSASLSAASPVVSAQLVATITQAAVHFSTDTVATQLSGPAIEMAKEGLRVLMFSKVKIAAAMVLTITVFVAGAGLLGRQIWKASGVALAPRETLLGALTQPRSPDAKPVAERSQARLDRFGDPLPEGAVARLGTVRFRQGWIIYSLAFSPDGKTLASGGWENAVRLWDVATGKEIRRFTPAKGQGSQNTKVASVAFSPDGKRLAAGTGNASSNLVIWETATGKEMQRFRDIQRQLTSIAFTPDGKGLAASDIDDRVRLWSVADGKVIHEFKGHPQWVHAIAFSPDGQWLASTGRDKTLRLWDAASGRELRQLKGHTDIVEAVAFSHDSKKLASGGHDNKIRLWNPASGKELRVLTAHNGPVCSLTFFPDGRRLASSGGDYDRGIQFWDTDAGKELTQMPRPQAPMVSVIAISRDGTTLAFDRQQRTVCIWDVAKGEERQPTNGSQGGLWHVAFSPDGQRIATGGEDEKVRLWDASSGNEVLHLRKPKEGFAFPMVLGHRLQFTADGKTLLLLQGYQLSRWGTDTGQLVAQRKYDDGVALLTPDGKFAVGRKLQGDFCLMDAATGKSLRDFPVPHSNAIAAGTAAISPDSKFLAANSPEENGAVVIWELATGKERCRCQAAPHLADALEFSPDGKYLAGTTQNLRVVQYGRPSYIYLWDTTIGREIRRLQAPGHVVTCLAYSSDGRMLASGGLDRTLRLWEVATGRERRCFEGHQGIVRSVAFSPDCTRLVSASDDTTALVWDATAPSRAEKPTAKQLQAAWNDLGSDDAVGAYRAIWLLARNPKQSVPLLSGHLPPARAFDAEIRKQVERWLTDLDSDQATVREQASVELEKRVVIAEPMLRKALTARPSLEQRKRIERVLERLEREQVTLGRALEALEHAHTGESRQLLVTLAAGEPNAWLTREAKAALRRR
jgi:RNA polymerase sigma factor (sigma-70 family)